VVYRGLPFALVLLIAGILFGFFVMVPYGFYFLAQLMNWADVGPLFTVADYFKFLLTLTVALGIVFQLPILMVALQKVGVLKFDTLRKNWRWVVMSFFVISAILTPPDPVTQMLMVAPMLTLFVLGLFLMWRVERRQARAAVAVES
jgi:Tat protein translocase TatC